MGNVGYDLCRQASKYYTYLVVKELVETFSEHCETLRRFVDSFTYQTRLMFAVSGPHNTAAVTGGTIK